MPDVPRRVARHLLGSRNTTTLLVTRFENYSRSAALPTTSPPVRTVSDAPHFLHSYFFRDDLPFDVTLVSTLASHIGRSHAGQIGAWPSTTSSGGISFSSCRNVDGMHTPCL